MMIALTASLRQMALRPFLMIFVRPENGNFFTRSDSDANDVLFNYGYRAGNEVASFNYDTSPKKLALNKKFFDEDFCRADPNLVLNRPAGVASCPITRLCLYRD